MISWRLVPSSLLKVSYSNGAYEISPKSQDWDKDGEFNETLYLHMLNVGFQSANGSETK